MLVRVLSYVGVFGAGYLIGSFLLLWAIRLDVNNDPEHALDWMLGFFERAGYHVESKDIEPGE